MVADRYAGRKSLDPGALALALGGTALFLFGLSLTAPNFVNVPDKVLKLIDVKADPPPPPHDPPKPRPRTIDPQTNPLPRQDPVTVTHPPVEPAPGSFTGTAIDTPPDSGSVVGTGAGTIPTPPVHVPVELGAQLDSRYADSFQPDYPFGERQAEHEGRVVVRVLIGVDGRVKAVEQVSAASRSFFEETRKRALAKWRFKPATRDGIPVEAWKEVGVSFHLEQ